MRTKILVIDDREDMVSFLRRLIGSEPGFEVLGLTNASEAVKTVSENEVDVVVADVKMPGKDGMTILKEIKESNRDIVVILLTGHGTVDMAVEALKEGAYDFLTKPVNNERLLHTVKRAADYRMVLKEKSILEEKIRHESLDRELIGESNVMKELFEKIRTVAATDETVLITGETGTGKELAARTIHRLSRRAAGPFIAVNCPAIPESILESELFGYRKGAFTSAFADRKGLFEAAAQGIIFLDEIGDIPLSVQTKLLRALQEKEFKPLGDIKSVNVDVRVVASTNRQLEKKIEQGLFRDDFYYRLNVITIRMPSLRERVEDIPLLSDYFLKRYSHKYRKNISGFSKEAVEYLKRRKWKGNVRELQNVIKRAIIFSKDKLIGKNILRDIDGINPYSEVMLRDTASVDYRTARNNAIEYVTRNYIGNILRKTNGNVTHAARLAGLERQSLQHLMRKYDIHPGDYKP